MTSTPSMTNVDVSVNNQPESSDDCRKCTSSCPVCCSRSKALLKDAEKKLTTLNETCDLLRREIEGKRQDYERDSAFTRNLLYTLGQKGFQAVTDPEGSTVVDLEMCQGDCVFDLKGNGKDMQKPKIRRIWGNEFYYKALIGNQERTIQNFHMQLEILRDQEISRHDQICAKCVSDFVKKEHAKDKDGGGETTPEGFAGRPTAIELEKELMHLIQLLDSTCRKYPEVYFAMNEQYQSEKSERNLYKTSAETLRTIGTESQYQSKSGGAGGVVEKVLERLKAQMSISTKRLFSSSRPRSSSQSQTQGTVADDGVSVISSRPVNTATSTSPNTKSCTSLPTPTPSEGPNQDPTNKLTRSAIELLDFEKFIGAAVLQLRVRERAKGHQQDENVGSVTNSNSNRKEVCSITNPESSQCSHPLLPKPRGNSRGESSALPPTKNRRSHSAKSCSTSTSSCTSPTSSTLNVSLFPGTSLDHGHLLRLGDRWSPRGSHPLIHPSYNFQNPVQLQSPNGASGSVSLDNQNSNSFPIVPGQCVRGTNSTSSIPIPIHHHSRKKPRSRSISPRQFTAKPVGPGPSMTSPRSPRQKQNKGHKFGVEGGMRLPLQQPSNTTIGNQRSPRSLNRSTSSSHKLGAQEQNLGEIRGRRGKPSRGFTYGPAPIERNCMSSPSSPRRGGLGMEHLPLPTLRPARPKSGNTIADLCRSASGMSCPYCHKDFKDTSPEEVGLHLEKHVHQS